MPKEVKRYTLAQYIGYDTRIVNSMKEYYEMIDRIKKYNNNPKKRYYFANISKQMLPNNRILVIICGYNKLTNKMSLKEIDDLLTTKTKKEIKDLYSDKLAKKSPSDIRIFYFYEKSKKEKDFFYDEDLRLLNMKIISKEELFYLNPNYVRKVIKSKKDDINFYYSLAKELSNYNYNSKTTKILEKLYCIGYKVEYENENIEKLVEIAIELFDSLLYKTNKEGIYILDENKNKIINQKILHVFSSFIEYYNLRYCPPSKQKIDNITDEEEFEKRLENEQDSINEEKELDRWDKEANLKMKLDK